jgi:hypothetical protein
MVEDSPAVKVLVSVPIETSAEVQSMPIPGILKRVTLLLPSVISLLTVALEASAL